MPTSLWVFYSQEPVANERRIPLSPPEIFEISNLYKNKELTDSLKSPKSPRVAVFHSFTLLNEIYPAKRFLPHLCGFSGVRAQGFARQLTCTRGALDTMYQWRPSIRFQPSAILDPMP